MTTIIYKDGMVATDKQGTDYNTASTMSCKAVLSEDGNNLYCITGELARGLAFAEWLEGDQQDKVPKLKGTTVFQMDMVTGKGLIWEDGSNGRCGLPVEEQTIAFGSGGNLALGAVEAGASLREAVKIAAKYDVYTGRGVQVFTSQAAKDKLKKQTKP